MGEIATLAPVVCWPWHLWFLADGDCHPQGASCSRCGRDIAVPTTAAGRLVCLYCALDSGLLPATEIPLCREE